MATDVNPVPPYTAPQPSVIMIGTAAVPRWEDGPSVMPPNPYPIESAKDWLPPPVSKTALFGAQQTWPL